MKLTQYFLLGWFIAILSVFSLFLYGIAHADEQGTVLLQKGQPATFTGYLLDPTRAQRVEWLQLDYDKLQKVDTLKDQEITNLNEQIQNSSKEIKDLNQELSSQNDSSHWKELGMFCLGVLATSFVAYGTIHVLR